MIIAWLLAYKYLIIIPGAIFEGPILSIICGLLIRLDVLNFWYAYFFLMLGDLIGDVLWYWAGYHWGKKLILKFGKYFSITEESIEIVKKLYHRYHFSILVASKLTMGLGFPGAVLATAGIVRISFRKFMLYNLIGQFVWTGGLIAIGYFVGEAYITINGGLEIFSLIAVILLAIVALFGFGKYVRKRVLKKYS